MSLYKFTPTPDFFSITLRGPRLTLRPYSEDRDFANIAALYQDPRVMAPMGVPLPKDFSDHLRLLKRSRRMSLDSGEWTAFIHEGETEIFAGEFGVTDWNRETMVVEIFCAICAKLSGKAYGREGVSLLMSAIFERDDIASVRITALGTNERSLALCRALGFRQTGSRFMASDPSSGFIGGTAIIFDCRAWEFKAFL